MARGSRAGQSRYRTSPSSQKVLLYAVAYSSAYHMLPFIYRGIRTYICIHIHTYAYFSNISEDVYTDMFMYIFFKWENK